MTGAEDEDVRRGLNPETPAGSLRRARVLVRRVDGERLGVGRDRLRVQGLGLATYCVRERLRHWEEVGLTWMRPM